MACPLQPTQIKPKILKNLTGCVAIQDKGQAIKAVKSLHPHAAIRVDSEVDSELLAKHDVREGKIVLLKQGS